MELNLRRAITWALLALLVLVPLALSFWSIYPHQIKDVFLVGIVALASMGWLWLSLGEERSELKLTPLMAVLGVNVLAWVVTLAASPHPEAGFPVLASRLGGLGFLLLGASFFGSRKWLRRAVGFLLFACSIMALYGVLQFFHLDPIFKTEGLVGHFRVSSTATHPNIFITFLVACLPLNLAAFWFMGRSATVRALLAGALVLNIAAAVATLSRAGLGAMGLTLVFTVVGLALLARRRTDDGEGEAGEEPTSGGAALKLGVPVVLALVALAALAVTKADLDPGERDRLLSLRGPTVQKRLLIWEGALKMAREDPVLGKGLGTFSLNLPRHRTAELARYFPRNEYHVEHGVSEPMEVLAESGLLGLAAWVTLAACFFFMPLAGARRARDPGLRALMLACSAGVLGLVAHGSVEVCLRFQPPLFMFWALPGIALAAARAAELPAPRSRAISLDGVGPRLAVSAAVGMALGLAFAITLSDFVANFHVHRGRQALERDDAGAAERRFTRAVGTWSGNIKAHYLRGYSLWKLGQLARAEAAYREVLRRSPYYFDVNHNLARVLFEQGKVDEAAARASEAAHLNPFHLPSHELWVRIALKQGKLPQARKLAAHMMKVGEDNALSHLTTARVQLADGKKGKARRTLDAALKRWPKDVGLKGMRAGL